MAQDRIEGTKDFARFNLANGDTPQGEFVYAGRACTGGSAFSPWGSTKCRCRSHRHAKRQRMRESAIMISSTKRSPRQKTWGFWVKKTGLGIPMGVPFVYPSAPSCRMCRPDAEKPCISPHQREVARGKAVSCSGKRTATRRWPSHFRSVEILERP